MATNTVSELSVYQVGDEEWWIASSAEHAIELSSDGNEMYEQEACLMTSEQMDEFEFHTEEGSTPISGTEQAARLRERGEWKPGPFAFAGC